MGSKISLLVYEWPLIWYMNGSIFQNFPKFEQKLAQIMKIRKNLVILLKLWLKIGTIGVFTFSWKIGIYATFKFCGDTSLPNPNLNTPRDLFCATASWTLKLQLLLSGHCATYSLDKDKHCHGQLQVQCCGLEYFRVCLFSPRSKNPLLKEAYQNMCIPNSKWHQEKVRYVVTTHHNTFVHGFSTNLHCGN